MGDTTCASSQLRRGRKRGRRSSRKNKNTSLFAVCVSLSFSCLAYDTVAQGQADAGGVESSCTTADEPSSYSPRGLDHGVLSWIASQKGGYYSPKQILDQNEDGLIGVFATEDIAQGEVLCRVPWKWVIFSKEEAPDEDDQFSCSLVRELQHQFQLGDNSRFAPYIKYLQHQATPNLPSAWSLAAQELILGAVLGQSREANNIRDAIVDFAPDGLTGWLQEAWREECQGTAEGDLAALIVLTRSDDAILIPGYDFYNHRNGEWHNADTTIKWGKAHETKALRDIRKGEQIYISYNRCSDCPGRFIGYGTAEIFRDYGFIEIFPQRWHYFQNNQIEFELSEYVAEDRLSGGEEESARNYTHVVKWIRRPPSNSSQIERIRQWLPRQIQRLERQWYIHYQHETYSSLNMTQLEWDTIWNFQRANLVAMRAALQALSMDQRSVPVESAPETSSLQVSDLYYTFNDDGAILDDKEIKCRMAELDQGIEILEQYDGFLQNIQVVRMNRKFEKMENLCLKRSGLVHVCSSFRPTYFEYFVHPAASLLPAVETVLILGSGASFLLHEVMKYTSMLQRVVVVEPDLAVTHLSEQYFGADPHFGDGRIDWWFGEVGEVLSLLRNSPSPEHYQFDLVLVDIAKDSLPTTFRNGMNMADFVDLDKGIMVSHTNQWQSLPLFEHTARMVFRLTAGCTHAWTLASHSVDFVRSPAKDHPLAAPNLVFQAPLMIDPLERLQLVHDWQEDNGPILSGNRQNATVQVFEDLLGVLQVVEMQNDQGLPLNDNVEIIKGALGKIEGLSVLSTLLLSGSNAAMLVLSHGGYLVLRVHDRTCMGLDIYWPTVNLELLVEVKATIVAALGGSIVSSYRLVSNGVAAQPIYDGRNTHEGALRIEESKKGMTTTDDRSKLMMAAFLARMFELLKPNGEQQHDILLVCEGVDKCDAEGFLSGSMAAAATIHVLEFDSSTQNGPHAMIEDERTSRRWLQSTFVDRNITADAIVLDDGLSRVSLQIMDGILNLDAAMAVERKWLANENVLVALHPPFQEADNTHKTIAERFHLFASPKARRIERLKEKSDVSVLAELELVNSDRGFSSEHATLVVQGKTATIPTLHSLVNEWNTTRAVSDNSTLTSVSNIRRLHRGPINSGPRLGAKRYDQKEYGPPAKSNLSPKGIQAFFQADASSEMPTSLGEISAATFRALKSMDLGIVKKLTIGPEATNTALFDFEIGHLIVTMQKHLLDFNLFYECEGDDEVDGIGCNEKLANELVERLLSKSKWHVFSMDFVARGATSTMVFAAEEGQTA